MKKYLIENIGCDDTTYTEIELTEEELKAILKFAKKNNNNSEICCQPIISIYDDYIISNDWYEKYKKGTDLTKEND